MATCWNCGAEVREGLPYCTACGKRLDERGKGLSPRTIAIIIVCSALVIAGVILGMGFLSGKTAHVSVRVVAPGYAEGDSPIPLVLEGKDLEGKEVRLVQYVDGKNKGFDVSAGEYEVSLLASPLCKSGNIYRQAQEPVFLEITSDMCAEGREVGCPDIELVVASASDVELDEVEAARKCAIESGMDADTADDYYRITCAKVDGAADELHVVMDGYTFDLPEYWRGKVDFAYSSNRYGFPEVSVYPKGCDSEKTFLVHVGAYPSDIPRTGGDIVSYSLYADDDASLVVQTHAVNWPTIAYHAAAGREYASVYYTADPGVLELLVDLVSLGSMTYDQVLAGETDAEYASVSLECTQSIVDTVSFSGEAVQPVASGGALGNPSLLDVSGGESATLYGTFERDDFTPQDTFSALGGPIYFVRFDEPISITYEGPTGVETRKYERLQVVADLTSTAQDAEVARNPWDVVTEYDQDLGRRVAVTGRILDAGSVYYVEGAAFLHPEMTIL